MSFIHLQVWKIVLLDIKFVVYSVVSFHCLKVGVSSHCLLAPIISDEKLAVNLYGVVLYVTCHFSLATFKVFSLSLSFNISMWISVYLSSLEFIEPPKCIDYFFRSNLGSFSHFFFQYFFCPCLTVLSFWNSFYAYLGALSGDSKFSEPLSLFFCLFVLFTLFLSVLQVE